MTGMTMPGEGEGGPNAAVSRAKILIVEDEGIVAYDMQTRLSSLGYYPDIALSGKEAVEKALVTRPDLILMDVMMPGEMDGVIAAEEIRAHFDVPIIYITAYADENTTKRAKITEPFGYIVKPFREKELQITIDMALYKHAMEKKLRESEEHYRRIIETANEGIIVTDLEGRMNLVNRKMADMLGYPIEELIGKVNIKFMPEDLRDKMFANWRKLGDEGQIQSEFCFRCKDGSLLWSICSAAKIFNSKGEHIGNLAMHTDITSRKKAEEALHEAYENLKTQSEELQAVNEELQTQSEELQTQSEELQTQSEELQTQSEELQSQSEELRSANDALLKTNKELEQFAYVASHDLQEPLRTVTSFTQLLEKRYKDQFEKDALEYLTYIVDGAKRMQQLVEDLLQFSRIGRTGSETNLIDCNEIIDKATLILKTSIDDTCAEVTYDDLPVVSANETSLTQLFQNLIGNAIKFRKKVEIPHVHISAQRNRDHWLFSVKDNGMGINSKYFGKIFVIFQRLNNRDDYPGTGIGLAICKKIVESFGGRIWVESAEGEGSTFYFTFPV